MYKLMILYSTLLYNYDDAYTRRQTRSLYARGNTIVRKFGKCLDSVKVRLYCMCSYGMLLLTHSHVTCIIPLKVTCNDCLRYLFRVGSDISMSKECIKLGIDCFNVVRRKSIFNRWNHLEHSRNSIICSIANSLYFISTNRTCKLWKRLLSALNQH